MQPLLRATLLATLACTTLAWAILGPAQAADVTPEQARALEGQLRAYFATLAGPDLPVEQSPIRVTPAGDHFAFAVPFDARRANDPTAPAALGDARPIDGGRWALDHLRVTSPATFTGTLKVPVKAGQKGANEIKGNAKPATTTLPITYTLTQAEQDGTGTWDPAYATPSIVNSTSRGLRLEMAGPGVQQTTTMERTASSVILRPAGGDRVDVVTDATGDGYALMNAGPDSPRVDATAQRVHVTGEVTGLSRDRAAALVPALIRIGKVQQAGQPKSIAPGVAGTGRPAAAKPGTDKAATEALIQAMQDFASAMTLTESIDTLQVHAGGFDGSFAQVRIGVDAKADGGFLTGHMDIGVDGLALAGMPLGPMQDLLPQRIALRPVVSHVPTMAVLQMLRSLMENPNAEPSDADAAALFSGGGLKTGLESFSFDVGGATFTGTADIDVASPKQASGAGQITAANWDVLFTKVQNTPELAQGIAVMVFAKGIAKTAGDRLVWDITFRDNKLLVNGTDLSRMGGGG